MTVRVAVIGAGVMGADHARIIAEDIQGASLHVVVDASADRARSVADAYGCADAGTDPLHAIARSDVDAVLIASPDDTHPALCLAAIGAGKPVLCEKPLAPTADACLPLIDAEVKAGRQAITGGFMRRFDPPYTAMRDTLRAGNIGAALMMHNIHRNVIAPPHFTGPMAITNSAPHEFDIIRFVLDAEITTIRATQPRAVAAGTRAPAVFLVMETSGGQVADVEVNVNAAYGYDVRAELVCETGTVSLVTPVAARLNASLALSEAYAQDWRPRFAEAYRLQNKAWIQTIASGERHPFSANAWDGYAAAAIAEAGVEALETGTTVPIVLQARPALYA